MKPGSRMCEMQRWQRPLWRGWWRGGVLRRMIDAPLVTSSGASCSSVRFHRGILTTKCLRERDCRECIPSVGVSEAGASQRWWCNRGGEGDVRGAGGSGTTVKQNHVHVVNVNVQCCACRVSCGHGHAPVPMGSRHAEAVWWETGSGTGRSERLKCRTSYEWLKVRQLRCEGQTESESL